MQQTDFKIVLVNGIEWYSSQFLFKFNQNVFNIWYMAIKSISSYIIITWKLTADIINLRWTFVTNSNFTEQLTPQKLIITIIDSFAIKNNLQEILLSHELKYINF